MTLTKTQKLIIMFGPLALGFICLGLMIWDLKHPVETTDSCTLVGRGLIIRNFAAHSRLLYSRGGKPENTIAFQCSAMGAVTINDDVTVPLAEGQPFLLTEKTYHWLPARYHLNLPVNNPNPVERAMRKSKADKP